MHRSPAIQLAHVFCDNLQMKYCPRCAVTKPFDEFFRKKGRKAGSYCKPCQLSYVREHYRRTSGAYNTKRYEFHAKYTARNQQLVIEYLSRHACVDCGERDAMVLELDHVSGTKLLSVSQMVRGGTSVASLQAEIATCVVRCVNCHRRKTGAERGLDGDADRRPAVAIPDTGFVDSRNETTQ